MRIIDISNRHITFKAVEFIRFFTYHFINVLVGAVGNPIIFALEGFNSNVLHNCQFWITKA